MDDTDEPSQFENPCPFRFTVEQYRQLGTLGFFGKRRVELIHGQVIDQYPGEPTGAGPRPFRFTREQFHQLGELGFFAGRRVELVLGELVVPPPIRESQVAGISLTADALRAAFGPRHYVRVHAPLNLAVIDPVPHVAVVPGGPRDYLLPPTTALLVVEVPDAGSVYERTTKAELYATAGVPEYWVLDVANRQLHVFRDPQPLPAGLAATAYQTHLTLAPADTVSPLAAPQASITVSDLLP